MRKKSIHLFLFLLILSKASFGADAFPLIGVDSKGRSIEKEINKKDWNRKWKRP